MIPTQTLESYPVFGDNATKIKPGDTKYANGFIEGDVYPAEWVNWKWAKDSKGMSDANTGLCSIEQEINNVLTCAGIAPNLSCTDQLYNAMICKIQDCVGTAAPKAHASAETTYGVGTADCYGHLKISDTYTEVLSSCTGVAASQKAVACVYTLANGKAAVGNTAGCAAGTAAAGTAITAARSDHVHPIPGCACSLIDVKDPRIVLYIGYACSGLTCAQITSLAAWSTNYEEGKIIIKDAPKAQVQAYLGLGSAAYCNVSCFRASDWTPASVEILCNGSGVTVKAEGGNEMNIYSANSSCGWINYRGGMNTLNIGSGVGNGSLGTVIASCFCGTATKSLGLKPTRTQPSGPHLQIIRQDTQCGAACVIGWNIPSGSGSTSAFSFIPLDYS